MHLTCVIPAHNEGTSIRSTLLEVDSACESVAPEIDGVTIFVSEDGSRDNTRDVIRGSISDARFSTITMSNPGPRLGYSRAVLRGLSAAESDLVWFMDSDGQYDPRDIWSLFPLVRPGTIVVGYRNPRVDSSIRKAYSMSFRAAYRLFGGPRLRDPSSPFVLAYVEDLAFLRRVDPHLEYGFWWEFQTRCAAKGLVVCEVPITHRVRATGDTQVYKPTKLPRIIGGHLWGLMRLRSELHS